MNSLTNETNDTNQLYEYLMNIWVNRPSLTSLYNNNVIETGAVHPDELSRRYPMMIGQYGLPYEDWQVLLNSVHIIYDIETDKTPFNDAKMFSYMIKGTFGIDYDFEEDSTFMERIKITMVLVDIGRILHNKTYRVRTLGQLMYEKHPLAWNHKGRREGFLKIPSKTTGKLAEKFYQHLTHHIDDSNNLPVDNIHLIPFDKDFVIKIRGSYPVRIFKWEQGFNVDEV
mgnify:CR=1 FL=1